MLLFIGEARDKRLTWSTRNIWTSGGFDFGILTYFENEQQVKSLYNGCFSYPDLLRQFSCQGDEGPVGPAGPAGLEVSADWMKPDRKHNNSYLLGSSDYATLLYILQRRALCASA